MDGSLDCNDERASEHVCCFVDLFVRSTYTRTCLLPDRPGLEWSTGWIWLDTETESASLEVVHGGGWSPLEGPLLAKEVKASSCWLEAEACK